MLQEIILNSNHKRVLESPVETSRNYTYVSIVFDKFCVYKGVLRDRLLEIG